MPFRNSIGTGANAIPLGARKWKFDSDSQGNSGAGSRGGGGGGGYNSTLQQNQSARPKQRYRKQQKPTRRFCRSGDSELSLYRERNTRWGDESSKKSVTDKPTAMQKDLNPEQGRAYTIRLRIEDIARRLRTGEVNISASGLENVQKAVVEIEKIIKQELEQPLLDDHLRKIQLMELAMLNVTLREDKVPREGARLRSEDQNVTNTTVCSKSDSRGKFEQDGSSEPGRQQGRADVATPDVGRAKMDSDNISVVEELGETSVPGLSSVPSNSNFGRNCGGGNYLVYGDGNFLQQQQQQGGRGGRRTAERRRKRQDGGGRIAAVVRELSSTSISISDPPPPRPLPSDRRFGYNMTPELPPPLTRA